MLEARVSRLHGHSSSSGALRVNNELDCLSAFELKLIEAGVLDQASADRTREEAQAEADEALEQATNEPRPIAPDVYKFTYAPSQVDLIYPDDYTGLP